MNHRLNRTHTTYGLSSLLTPNQPKWIRSSPLQPRQVKPPCVALTHRLSPAKPMGPAPDFIVASPSLAAQPHPQLVICTLLTVSGLAI